MRERRIAFLPQLLQHLCHPIQVLSHVRLSAEPVNDDGIRRRTRSRRVRVEVFANCLHLLAGRWVFLDVQFEVQRRIFTVVRRIWASGSCGENLNSFFGCFQGGVVAEKEMVSMSDRPVWKDALDGYYALQTMLVSGMS